MEFLDKIIEKETRPKVKGLTVTLNLKGTATFSEIVQVIGDFLNDDRIPKKIKKEYRDRMKDICERTLREENL